MVDSFEALIGSFGMHNRMTPFSSIVCLSMYFDFDFGRYLGLCSDKLVEIDRLGTRWTDEGP
jgi:hypothetical protein